jgi:Pyridoxamine 5'-phosphate oxidase
MSLLREIIDANPYMTLGTADARGTPWASPVWFAHEGYREFMSRSCSNASASSWYSRLSSSTISRWSGQ